MDRKEIGNHYVQALGLEQRSPTFSFLNDITQQHVARFAFSSVGPRLGDELPLDLLSLYQRIVVQHRGGYCFEQNGLLFGMLEELGFEVTLYLARVIYNQDIHPGLTHRITLVKIDGQRYIVDVGFGPLGPRKAVSMSGQASTEFDRVFKIAEPRPGEFHMQTLREGEFFSLYRFELVRYGQSDCEVGHFYSHKHPKATFVNHLVVSRILDREVRALRNLEFRVITGSGETMREIGSADQLLTILVNEFGVRVTAAESQYLFKNSP